MLSDEFLSKYRTTTPPFDTMGYVTYKRTYSRRLGERTEEWWETCRRTVNSIAEMAKKYNYLQEDNFGYLQDKECLEKLYDLVFNMKLSFSGRAMWQLGTDTVNKCGGASLNNCWGVVVDHPDAFVFTFDMLMLGGGVGFNIQKEFVYRLPKIKSGVTVTRLDTKDADFIVPDSREGWCELLRRTLNAYFNTGKGFSYSTILVRGKGAIIKGFGGTASGPEDLCYGIGEISKIMNARSGKQLRPIDCLDIMNLIGHVVVAGNIRRSAMLALGDMDDLQYLSAKNWSGGSIPNWRGLSNNSVVCNDIAQLPEKFWDGYKTDPKTGMAKGEPYGLINLKLSQTRGRITEKKSDPGVLVFNPCAEIGLAPPEGTGQGEACNLVEIILPKITDYNEFKICCLFGYYITKLISMNDYHWDKTNEIIHKNMRLGISVTGICQAINILGKDTLAKWLNDGYKAIENQDINNDRYGRSIKLTCQKPSGTISTVMNVTAGIHPAYSEFYIRRIRFQAQDPLIDILRNANYNVEPEMRFDGSLNHDTLVVSFPMKAPEGATIAKNMTAIDQLEMVKFMNTWWSDNSTSVTVYYKESELHDIRKWLDDNYNKNVKSVSFLLHKEHGFKQAPYEEISEVEYRRLSSKLKPISMSNTTYFDGEVINAECSTGACPIR